MEGHSLASMHGSPARPGAAATRGEGARHERPHGWETHGCTTREGEWLTDEVGSVCTDRPDGRDGYMRREMIGTWSRSGPS